MGRARHKRAVEASIPPSWHGRIIRIDSERAKEYAIKVLNDLSVEIIDDRDTIGILLKAFTITPDMLSTKADEYIRPIAAFAKSPESTGRGAFVAPDMICLEVAERKNDER